MTSIDSDSLLSEVDVSERLEPLGLANRLVVDELKPLLPGLIKAYLTLKDAPETRKTHLFGGRYENIYIDRSRLPELDKVLKVAVAAASTVAKIREPLQVGCWFNEMQPGQETTLHTHDDDDEVLSGVFYVTVPENSGDLLLVDGDEQIAIPPVESAFVFFSPRLPHAVGKNRSEVMRLSIGMNFGIPERD
jgi:hypothetical protein